MQNETFVDEQYNIPKPTTFLTQIPPYKSYNVDKDNYFSILQLEFYNASIDCYCKTCDKESTFQRVGNHLPTIFDSIQLRDYDISAEIEKNYKNIPDILSFQNNQDGSYINIPIKHYALTERNFIIAFRCSRCSINIISFFFTIANSKITKSGQYPSIADLERSKVKKYSTLLGKDKTEELNTALRLFSNGIGIGSFVYLRRTFEFLIEEAHKIASLSTSWDEDEYRKSRVDEKVMLLQGYLPHPLIENRIIYSILSKGIHELSNDECLEYFNPIYIMIELILDKKIEDTENDRKAREIKNAINSIVAKLK